MKKALTLLLALCLTAGFSACGSAPASNESAPSNGSTAPEASTEPSDSESNGGTFKVGVAIPTSQEELWTLHSAELEAACKAKGWEVIVQSANGDSDKQIAQIENMLTAGIDALILGAADPGATGTVVKQAHDEGVFVIGYDRVDSKDPYDYFVTFDNVAVGKAMAEYCISKNPSGNYALLQGDATTVPACQEIHQGWLEVLQPYVDDGDITIAYDQNCKNWSTDEGLAQAENALTATDNVMTAILCANDGIAAGAGQAVASAGLTGKVIVTGQDSEVSAAQRIVAGTQDITLYKAPSVLAAAAAEVVDVLLNGGTPEADGDFDGIPMITEPPVVVSADNLDQVFIESGFMTKEQVYG